MGIRFSTGARRLLGRPGRTPGARRAVARVGLAALGALAIGVGVAACGSSSSADSSGPVDIVAYSTPETVYKEGLIPAFKKTSQGSGADFSTSFGPSGDQSRAVEAGQPASVVHFSIQPDMQRLVDAGLVDSNWDQKAGEDVDYVIPKDTIQIQTPIATTTDASTTAQDFVKWLYTPEAQQIWADNGYRPVVKSVLDKNAKEFPTPPGLFTIDKLGGWDQVTTKFFDENNGIVTKDEQDLGDSTSG